MKLPSGLVDLCLLMMIVIMLPTCSAHETTAVRDSSIWEAEIAALENKDKQRPPTGGVLFYGSSSIRYWDLPKSFPDLKVVNHGFGGSHIADCIYYLHFLKTDSG